MGFTDDLGGVGTLQDRDKVSFAPDGNNGVARKVKIVEGDLVMGINGDADSIFESNPSDVLQIFTWEKSAVVVQTLTITWVDSCREAFVSAIYT